MTPESVGLSGSTLTLGKLSGRAGFDERLRRLGIHVEPETLDTLYARGDRPGRPKKQVTDADLLALAEQHADPVPQLVEIEHWAAASRQGESSSGNVSLFYDGRDIPRLRRRQRAGGCAPLGGRQRPRADHRRPPAAGRLRAAEHRRGRGCPGRGDREDRRACRRRRRAAACSPATAYRRTSSRRACARTSPPSTSSSPSIRSPPSARRRRAERAPSTPCQARGEGRVR